MNNYVIIYSTKLFKDVHYPFVAKTDGQAITKACSWFKNIDKIVNQENQQIIYQNGKQNFY